MHSNHPRPILLIQESRGRRRLIAKEALATRKLTGNIKVGVQPLKISKTPTLQTLCSQQCQYRVRHGKFRREQTCEKERHPKQKSGQSLQGQKFETAQGVLFSISLF